MTSMKEDTSTQAPYNGLSLSKSSREPSFVQKRKQSGHEQRLTRTTSSNHELHDLSSDIPTNKALLYKAGYRRVHFDQPTEYRMQFGWPSPDHSPILDAIPTIDTAGISNSKKNDTNTTDHKYKHVINGAHVNGRTHVIVKEPTDKPKPVSTDIKQKETCATRLQERLEKRMNKAHISSDHDRKADEKVRKSQLNSKKKSKTGPIAVEKLQSDQNASHPSTKPSKLYQEGSSSVGVTRVTKDKENIPDQNPPMLTEYQSTFRYDHPEEKENQLRNSCHVIGLKDHVKDIIYSMKSSHDATPINKPPVCDDSSTAVNGSGNGGSTITPVSQYPSLAWVTEYSANFGSPLQMKYVNGVWQGVARPDDLIKSPRTANTGKSENTSKPSPPSSTTAWFNQVLELRKKVEEFKCRGDEGTEPLFNYSFNQEENNDQDHHLESEMSASVCSSISSNTEVNDGNTCATTVPVTTTQPHEITDPSSDHRTTDSSDESIHQRIDHGANDESIHQRMDRGVSDQTKGVQKTVMDGKKPSAHRLGRTIAPVIPKRGTHNKLPNTSSNPKMLSKVPKRRDYGPRVSSSSALYSPQKDVCDDPLRVHTDIHVAVPSSVPKQSYSLSDTCQTCGGISNSHPEPSNHYQVPPPVQSVDCGICDYSANKKLTPIQVSSPSYKKTVPICPPSCPNSSLCRAENYSLSPVSATSSCSVARDILERAKHRQNNIWKK